MKNKWITIGGIFGFLGVAIGAFGAHTLKPLLNPETFETYKTGVQYHLVHAVVILAIGFYNNAKFSLAAWFFTIGIILFSFSLYIYSLANIQAFGIITPFGGICFLAGWLLIIVNSFRIKKE